MENPQSHLKPMKIKRISASEQVCSRIKDCIRSEEWAIGEKIPSESDLAAMFGVNRLTVRMALQKLNTLGIVETRVGEGTFVKDFDFHNYIQEVSEFYIKPEMLDDVCDFRKLIEIECARLAMEKATPEEMETLAQLERKYRQAALLAKDSSSEEDFQQMVEADLEFHAQICRMSHNSLYLYAFTVAREPIYEYLKVIIRGRMTDPSSETIGALRSGRPEIHGVIRQALADKDFETLKKAYLDMVDRHIAL